mmetsp:Transcript_34358/g.102865  ORF Transcript_34358/g.102865 Transcript_34358/m.102865 type:complete len:102 (-) Transcript_34358:23-328(-)
MTARSDLDLPEYSDVVEAAAILDGVANKTDVLTSRTLDKELGVRVFVKPENLQRMGAFKVTLRAHIAAFLNICFRHLTCCFAGAIDGDMSYFISFVEDTMH